MEEKGHLKLQSTTFIESQTHDTFVRDDSRSNIVLQQIPPLHSYRGFPAQIQKPGFGVCTQSKSYIKPLRPPFGSHNKRQSMASQGNVLSSMPGPATYYIQSRSLENKNSIAQPTNRSNINCGFNISANLQRIDSLVMRKNNNGPGPGSYEPKTAFGQERGRPLKIRKEDANRSHVNRMSSVGNESEVPGPGAYKDSQGISHTISKEKELWNKRLRAKQMIKDRALKSLNKNFEAASPARQQNFVLQQIKLKREQQCKERPPNKKGIATLNRRQLAEQTSKFLPNIKENSVHFVENYDHKLNSGPSNSFLPKNDHAYQAHFYQPKQKESEYFFFAGRPSGNDKNYVSSHMFRSTSLRKCF